MAMLEAMANSVPVVVTTVGAIPEVVKDGVHGRLFTAGDVKKLAECLMDLLNNAQDGMTMGRNGRKTVIANYSVEKSADILKEVYQMLMIDNNKRTNEVKTQI